MRLFTEARVVVDDLPSLISDKRRTSQVPDIIIEQFPDKTVLLDDLHSHPAQPYLRIAPRLDAEQRFAVGDQFDAPVEFLFVVIAVLAWAVVFAGLKIPPGMGDVVYLHDQEPSSVSEMLADIYPIV